MKNIRIFLSENFQFLVVKFSLYLNRPVFVMIFSFTAVLYLLFYTCLIFTFSILVFVRKELLQLMLFVVYI